MANDWIKGKLGELVNFTPKRTIKKSVIAPFISMADVTENSKFISNFFEKEYTGGGCRFKNGDTLFARITPCLQNGKCSKVSGMNDDEIGHGSTEFIVFSPINPKYDEDYIYYLARMPDFRAYAESRMIGSTGRQRVSWQDLADYDLFFPEKNERRDIGQFLSGLDDKIELNRQMNETLEAMAQALFKSWFVDFDPVIDNALAAGKPIPDELSERAEQRKAMQHGDNQAVRALFPDEFVLTEEMGWIPKGWVVTDVKNSAEKISKGTTPSQAILSKANDENSIPFLKVRDLDDEGKIDTQSLDLIPKSIHENALKRSILKKGDLLFSIAGTIGRVSIVPRELDNSNSNQALAFIRPKDITKTYFLLQFLKSQEVQKEINSRIVQAVQANVSLTELGSLKFAQASDELFRKWHSIVQNWIEKISFIQVENSHLTKIRDTLLPKLLSGELRIPDAAALVEDI